MVKYEVTNLWTNRIKAIARVNTIFENMDKAASLGMSQAKIDSYIAEACFIRASMYSNLISHFGDVVYVTNTIDIDEAFKIGRTPKVEILKGIYADYDKAIEGLPQSYPASQDKERQKGAAMALKARIALYMGDWQTAADAAKACIDLKQYQLHKSFSDLFLTTTRNAEESIFLLPRSIANKVTIGNGEVLNIITRNPGGWAAKDPSWDLLASFLCTDGLPIDESPLFDSHDPFKNRDPRCAATIVPLGMFI
jgi:hypothetical protein